MKKLHKPITIIVILAFLFTTLVGATAGVFGFSKAESEQEKLAASTERIDDILYFKETGLNDLSPLPISEDIMNYKEASATKMELQKLIFGTDEEDILSQSLLALSEKEAEELLSQIKTGRELYNQGKYDQALEKYQLAINLAPQIAPLYFERGQVYLSLENTKQALSDFNECIRLDPQLTIVYFMRGKLYAIWRA